MQIRIKTKKVEAEIKTNWYDSLGYFELMRFLQAIFVLDDKAKFSELRKDREDKGERKAIRLFTIKTNENIKRKKNGKHT